MFRKITEVIIHCTATPQGRFVDVPTVNRWHRERGFRRSYQGKTYHIGYHFLIGLDGEIWKGRPVEISGAHVKGRNGQTIGVAYVGGVDATGKPKDTRTPAQKAALLKLLRRLLSEHPSIEKISSHRDYAAKACPSFDATSEYASLLTEEPVKPAFSNPVTEDAQPDHQDSAFDLLEQGNLLQKQALDALQKAAGLHWKAKETLRKTLPNNEV